MTYRTVADVVQGQKLLALGKQASVQEACRRMWEGRKGSVLIVDHEQHLLGIFTGRDAVRTLAEGRNAEMTSVSHAMTRNPVTIASSIGAIDALRKMNDYGFRHLPVVDGDTILGVVSRGDFKGIEIERLDDDEHLAELLR